MNEWISIDVDRRWAAVKTINTISLQQVYNIALIRNNRSRIESIYSSPEIRNHIWNGVRWTGAGATHEHAHQVTKYALSIRSMDFRVKRWFHVFSGLSDANAAKRQAFIRRTSRHTSCLCNGNRPSCGASQFAKSLFRCVLSLSPAQPLLSATFSRSLCGAPDDWQIHSFGWRVAVSVKCLPFSGSPKMSPMGEVR